MTSNPDMRIGDTERLRVVIADDEPLARARLHGALTANPGLEIVAECADGLSAVETICAAEPDLVFLDVQMPGLDGFGVVDAVGPERMPAVVFVTAHDMYALRAFEAQAIDYLLKPFEDRRLADVVARVEEQVRLRRRGRLADQLTGLLQYVGRTGAQTPKGADQPTGYLFRLTVRDDDRVRFVRVDEVDYFESSGNYVRLHIGERVCRIRHGLALLAERLNPRHFARIHKSTIVNLDRVAEVQPWFGGDHVAIMRDGRKLRVSRTYAPWLFRHST